MYELPRRVQSHILPGLSPPQRLPLGIPIKISIIEKNRKRAGDDGKRAPRALFFFLPSLNTKASPTYKEASAEERASRRSVVTVLACSVFRGQDLCMLSRLR